MSFPTAPRRPSRVVAAALLLILHLVAIGLFLSLQATRERSNERLVTLLLLALTKPAPTPPVAVAKALPPRKARVPPVPVVNTDPLRSIHDSATPVAAPQANAGTPGAAASAPASGPLNLAIPKDFFAHPPPLTPAQEAMQDPRSNRLVLTKQEQMDVDFGVFECIAWQREPDGSIYRGPGHYQRIQGISTNPFTTHKPGHEDRGMECVK